MSESSEEFQRLSDFDYYLPTELIADRPLEERDASRMMVIDRARGTIEHRRVRDLPDLLKQGDLAVMNDSRVIPARLLPDDGEEILLLEPLSATEWICLVRPGKRFRVGMRNRAGGAELEVLEVLSDGSRRIAFDSPPDLSKYGSMPIPPYMQRPADEADRQRYQTVYARHEGSVAAPTAGLHFSPDLLRQVSHTFVTLHVGVGTFRPVQCEKLADHAMHEERYTLTDEAVAHIAAARKVLAVGTTVVRVLESQTASELSPTGGRTDLFIRPPYAFKWVDMLMTNFHLPKSSLLMLVGAFSGVELIREAYQKAVEQKYRFFSYGDCMLIR